MVPEKIYMPENQPGIPKDGFRRGFSYCTWAFWVPFFFLQGCARSLFATHEHFGEVMGIHAS